MRKMLLVTLLLALAFPAAARADDGGPAVIGGLIADLVATGDSGVHGVVSAKAITPELTEVTLVVAGLPANASRVNHIHRGSCQNQGAVAYPLAQLVADGNGLAIATTLVGVSLGTLAYDGYYVNVHAAEALPAPGIACGNLSLIGP